MTIIMKPAYQITVLVAFLLYFSTFLTGRPGVEVDPYAGSGTSFTEPDTADDPESSFIPHTSLYEENTSKSSTWKTGLIKRVYLEHKSRTLFNDSLLVSDARPDNLFKNIDRAYTGDIFFLAVNIVWIFMFLFAIITLLKRHWFYAPFIKMLLYPSVLFLAVVLLTSRRENTYFTDNQLLAFAEIIIESLLMFSGLALIFYSSLPVKMEKQISFMEHLNLSKLIDPAKRSKNKAESLFQIFILFAVSIILSNLILLPVYKLQVTFPGLFALLLISVLFALAFFYITAYMRVSSSSEPASVFSGIAFLGFRFLRNALFLINLMSIVILVVAAVIFLANINIELLQFIQLLEKKEGF